VSEFSERIGRLRELADKHGLESIVLRRNPNLAWAIGGRVHVPLTVDLSCFDLIITKEKTIAITNKIEAPRLIAEEFPAEVEVIAIDWWEGRDAKLPSGEKIGSDQPGGSRIDLSIEVEQLRQSLSESEVVSFRNVCADSAVALGEAIKLTTSIDREIDVTARIASALWQRDLDLVFIGVAGESRVKKFRHPLPTEAAIGNRVVA